MVLVAKRSGNVLAAIFAVVIFAVVIFAWSGIALSAAPACQQDYEAAEAKCTTTLAACGNCPELAAILNNLGGLYYTTGRYAEAGALYQRALSLREVQAGTMALALLPPLNNLALLYRETADYAHALKYAELAVSIVDLDQAAEPADGAASFANLGAILEVQGEIGDAKKWLEGALGIREPVRGVRHFLVAATVS